MVVDDLLDEAWGLIQDAPTSRGVDNREWHDGVDKFKEKYDKYLEPKRKEEYLNQFGTACPINEGPNPNGCSYCGSRNYTCLNSEREVERRKIEAKETLGLPWDMNIDYELWRSRS